MKRHALSWRFNGTITVMGTGDPNLGAVEVEAKGNGEFTVMVTVNAADCSWTATLTNVPPGNFVVKARFATDGAGAGAADLITMR